LYWRSGTASNHHHSSLGFDSLEGYLTSATRKQMMIRITTIIVIPLYASDQVAHFRVSPSIIHLFG